MAVKSANKTEETARRWLSIMSRDCTRFCKIMVSFRFSLYEKTKCWFTWVIISNTLLFILIDEWQKLSEAGSCAPGNIVNKERKITFADEAGGKLCHVKVFKDDMTSEMEHTDTEK